MRYRVILISAVIGLLGIFPFLFNAPEAAAQQKARQKTEEVDVSQYIWGVYSTYSGKRVCEVLIEYDRPPTADEILAACADLFNPPASPTSSASATSTPQPAHETFDPATFLKVVILKLEEIRHFKKTVTIPMMQMAVDIRVPEDPVSEPYVLLSAYEPEPDYHITSIQGTINSHPFVCDQSQCRVPVTTDSFMEFWSTSSFGDESEHVQATIRLLPEGGLTRVNLESVYPYQFYTDSCAQIWGSTDNAGIPWAVFPTTPEQLHTNKDLYFLTRELILNGVVNANDCPGKGFLSDGSPNACGMERAKTEATRWQNQYDFIIWSASHQISVPPILIKTLLEIESQFWPANSRYVVNEFGLGQINEVGADVALRWDNDLYQQVCNGLLFDCSIPYASQPPSLQAILRGGLIRGVNSECATCQYGIDYSKSAQSVPTVARVLRSNCRQVKKILDNNQVKAGYEDSWKFTLVSFHSGYDCLNNAIAKAAPEAFANETPVKWDTVSKYIDPGCFGAVEYVDTFWNSLVSFPDYQIKPEQAVSAIPQATIVPTPVPSPSPTPIRAKSKIQVVVFVDKNNNGTMDKGEEVNNLEVIAQFADGSKVSRNTVNGIAEFDMTGRQIDEKVVFSIPLLFRSKETVIPENGILQLPFRLQQPAFPSVLP